MTEKKTTKANQAHSKRTPAKPVSAHEAPRKPTADDHAPQTQASQKNGAATKAAAVEDRHESTSVASSGVTKSEASGTKPETVTPSTEQSPQTSAPAHTAEEAAKPPSKSRRILDVFLVDSGWNNEVANAVRENLPVFDGYLRGQRFYVLNEEQSLAFIKKHPALVGADPILIVLDREAALLKTSKGYGFRLCLGHMRNPEAALSMLKWAIQLSMAANGPEMASIVKESGHRQTIQGTIELLGEGSAHLLEFAPV